MDGMARADLRDTADDISFFLAIILGALGAVALIALIASPIMMIKNASSLVENVALIAPKIKFWTWGVAFVLLISSYFSIGLVDIFIFPKYELSLSGELYPTDPKEVRNHKIAWAISITFCIAILAIIAVVVKKYGFDLLYTDPSVAAKVFKSFAFTPLALPVLSLLENFLLSLVLE